MEEEKINSDKKYPLLNIRSEYIMKKVFNLLDLNRLLILIKPSKLYFFCSPFLTASSLIVSINVNTSSAIEPAQTIMISFIIKSTYSYIDYWTFAFHDNISNKNLR